MQRVRWDRLGRYGLLTVLVVVVGLYAQHTISFLGTRAQAQQDQAYVRELVRENRVLEREQLALRRPATILARARSLGMVRSGERAFVVIGH
jgi:cell division protein FtsB